MARSSTSCLHMSWVDLRLLPGVARPCRAGVPSAEPGSGRASGAAGAALDLEAGTLDIGPTRVVVDGKVIESDGKTENAQHVLALDPFTVAVLTVHADMLDREREEFGPDYHHLGLLFCWENGLPPHPDTITSRFKKISRDAGLPDIDLHDVRCSCLTAGRKARIDRKALSQRVGHSDVAFTMRAIR
jgi:integrase